MSRLHQRRITERRPVERDGLDGRKRMLVATRSFEYVDPYTGRQNVRAGVTHVVDDHWLVGAFPDAWKLSDREDRGVLDSAPVAIETTHPDDRN